MRSGEGGVQMMFGGGGNRVKDDGTFVLPERHAGRLRARSAPMGMMGRRGGDDDPEAAFTTVSVGGEDVTGVTLTGTKGTSLRGQVVVQPASAATGIKPSDVSVNAMAKDPDAPMMFMGGKMRDRLDDDWTFELKAVQSPVLIRTFRMPAGYSLKAVLLNGTDVTDTGIAFKPGEPVTGLQVVLSTTSSGVTGSVTDDNGKPVADYAAIVFSEDPTKWGYMSRHVDDGAARSAGRLPGEEPAARPLPGGRGRSGRRGTGNRSRVPRTPAVAGDSVHPRRRRAAIGVAEDRPGVLMTDVNHRDTESTEDAQRSFGKPKTRSPCGLVFSVSLWLVYVIIQPRRARRAAPAFPSASA